MSKFDFNSTTDKVLNSPNPQRPGAPPVVKPEAAKPSPQSTPTQPQVADPLDPNAENQEIDLDDELANLAKADPAQNKVELRRGRFDNLYQSHKAWKQVSDFLPTVADARAAYEKSTEFDQLYADFASGDPAAAESFLQYWAGSSPEGVAAMAERFPDVLRSSNPQAYDSLQTRILNDITEANYAAAGQDPEAFHKAQMFEWTQTGKYRQMGDVKAPDPLAQREAAISQREQQIAQQDRQAAEQKVTQWKSTTFQTIAGAVDKEVLSTVGKAAEAFSPKTRQALINQSRQALTQEIQKDQVWMTDFNLKFQQAQRLGTPEAQQAVRDIYLQKARTLIKAVAKPFFTDATRVAVQANQAMHDKSQLGSTQVAPNGGKPINPGAPQAVRPGASTREKVDAFFAASRFGS